VRARQVSATSFTVVGIVCKLATVVVNLLIWDKHATPAGLAALGVCLFAGSIYQQAPLRSEKLITKSAS
jgi:solute carrier family 35 protein